MRHAYKSSREKRVDFWAGYTGWFATYIVVYTVALGVSSGSSGGSIGGTFDWLYLLLNLGVMIALAFTRAYAALGVLAAIATAVALVVVEGGLFVLGASMASAISSSSNSVGIALLLMVVGFLPFAAGCYLVLRAVNRRIR